MERLNLPTLLGRRERADMIEIYRIVKGMEILDSRIALKGGRQNKSTCVQDENDIFKRYKKVHLPE